jgi:predicted KAP-like P-loop ATPase
LRVCSPDTFDIYFQFGVQPDSLSRAELDELLAVASDEEKAIGILAHASEIIRPDGTSKAREYLERLRDLTDEITPEVAKGLLIALFHVGDTLLSPGDEKGGFVTFPNRWRLHGTVNYLLKRIPVVKQKDLLCSLIESGQALSMIVDIVCDIEDYLSKPEKAFGKIKLIVLDRLCQIDEQHLLEMPDLDYVINSWLRWAGPDVVRSRILPIIQSNLYLPQVLEKYLSFSIQQGSGDRISRNVPRLDPKWLEPLTNIFDLELRVEQMLLREDLTSGQRVAGEQFIKGMERIRQGKNADVFFDND